MNLVNIYSDSQLLQKQSPKALYRNLIEASTQNALSFSLEFLPNTIALYFLEQTNNQVWVGAFGMGTMICQAFGLGVLNGLGCGLETLVSQAFGQGNLDLCAKLYYMALYVSLLLMIPISIFLYYAGDLVHLINENQELTDALGQYSRWMILAVFLNGIFVNTKVFLNGQNVYNYQCYTQAITSIFSVFFNYLFVIYLDLGFIGCALSRTMLEISNNLILFSFIKKYNVCTLIPFQKSHLEHSWKFCKAAFPIGTILWFEWMSFELYTMQSSYLSESLLGANVVMSSLCTLFYQFSYGISIAATTFVGNEMGRKSTYYAKQYAFGSLYIQGIFLVISQSLIYLESETIIELLTNDIQVRKELGILFPLLIIYIIVDAFQALLSGLVRGIGREKIASITFIISYFGIGQLSAYTFCYLLDLKLTGIWIGMIAGAFSYDVMQIINMFWQRWDHLADEIEKKMHHLGGHGTIEQELIQLS